MENPQSNCVARITQETIAELGWEVLSHLAHSSNMPLSDHQLWQTLGSCTDVCSKTLEKWRNALKNSSAWSHWPSTSTESAICPTSREELWLLMEIVDCWLTLLINCCFVMFYKQILLLEKTKRLMHQPNKILKNRDGKKKEENRNRHAQSVRRFKFLDNRSRPLVDHWSLQLTVFKDERKNNFKVLVI